MKKRTKIVIVLAIVMIIFILLVILRVILPRQIDDVNPSRFCDSEFLNKSEIFMVIPLLGNQSIADDPVWCKNILKLNKTLGMHGVYHTENEFMNTRDRSYIQRGMEEFNKCFGFYPNIFLAPEFSLSEENEKTLREMNFTIIKLPYDITHKVYHCTDYENKSWLVKLNILNKII